MPGAIIAALGEHLPVFVKDGYISRRSRLVRLPGMQADAPSRHMLLPALDTERPISGTSPHREHPLGAQPTQRGCTPEIRAAWAIARLRRGLAHPVRPVPGSQPVIASGPGFEH
jgi:hypothetical protein